MLADQKRQGTSIPQSASLFSFFNRVVSPLNRLRATLTTWRTRIQQISKCCQCKSSYKAIAAGLNHAGGLDECPHSANILTVGRNDGGRKAHGEKFRVPKLNIDINKQIMGARGASELCILIEARVAEFNHVVTAPHTCRMNIQI
jgi:hypothetical protein